MNENEMYGSNHKNPHLFCDECMYCVECGDCETYGCGEERRVKEYARRKKNAH